jgi:hypothetical protein
VTASPGYETLGTTSGRGPNPGDSPGGGVQVEDDDAGIEATGTEGQGVSVALDGGAGVSGVGAGLEGFSVAAGYSCSIGRGGRAFGAPATPRLVRTVASIALAMPSPTAA